MLAKEQSKLIEQQKEEVFNKIMIALGDICDPIAMNLLVNRESRVNLFLLPDNII